MQPPQQNAPVNLESQQPLTAKNNPPFLEDAPVHVGTPWPEAVKISGNLFEIRKDCPIPPTTKNATITTTNPKQPAINVEPQDPDQSNPNSTITKPERCRLGPNWVISKNAEQNWDGEHQKQLQQSNVQQKYPSQGWDTRQAPVHNCQHPKNYQVPQSKHSQASFNVPDQYAEQICLRKEWEKKMEQLNKKYGLDWFSDLELDSEFDEEESYQYEHKYEMLI